MALFAILVNCVGVIGVGILPCQHGHRNGILPRVNTRSNTLSHLIGGQAGKINEGSINTNQDDEGGLHLNF